MRTGDLNRRLKNSRRDPEYLGASGHPEPQEIRGQGAYAISLRSPPWGATRFPLLERNLYEALPLGIGARHGEAIATCGASSYPSVHPNP